MFSAPCLALDISSSRRLPTRCKKVSIQRILSGRWNKNYKTKMAMISGTKLV
jgi:hypothetical protein